MTPDGLGYFESWVEPSFSRVLLLTNTWSPNRTAGAKMATASSGRLQAPARVVSSRDVVFVSPICVSSESPLPKARRRAGTTRNSRRKQPKSIKMRDGLLAARNAGDGRARRNPQRPTLK